jgi:glycerol-3-phosphate acyltransferase PlsY
VLLPPILALALGYLLGSIPFGLILTRAAGAGDLRAIGSGNIGATNVLRTGRRDLAAATLVLDALKGTAAVLAAGALFGGSAAQAAALGALLGHMFPVWLGFRGGKGVATYLGCAMGVSIVAALAFAAAWLLTAALTRLSSAGALVACMVTPMALLALGQPSAALIFLVMAALVWIRHRANIERLIAGTEPRIGQKAAEKLGQSG